MHTADSVTDWAMGSDEFIDSLFARSEAERNELARLLHDQMGGLMVAAAMDISWVESNLRSLGEEERFKFVRIREGLKEAIDLKRAIIERLRPTLLDTFGLFAALRWLLKNRCTDADVVWTETYLDAEPLFTPAAAIILFRIVEDALSLLLVRDVTALDLSVAGDEDDLVVRISASGQPHAADAANTQKFVGLQHRARSLQGKVRIVTSEPGGSQIAFHLPWSNLLGSGVDVR